MTKPYPLHSLCDNLRKSRSYQLKCKPDHGKTQPCSEKSKISGHYLRTGDFIRLGDWRFIRKARLNLLPLNGCKPGNPKPKQKCRRGDDPFEGLPHVLCHCKSHMQDITARHNNIVAQLLKASTGTWSVYKENQPPLGSLKRPDLVLKHNTENAAIIIDVAVHSRMDRQLLTGFAYRKLRNTLKLPKNYVPQSRMIL